MFSYILRLTDFSMETLNRKSQNQLNSVFVQTRLVPNELF